MKQRVKYFFLILFLLFSVSLAFSREEPLKGVLIAKVKPGYQEVVVDGESSPWMAVWKGEIPDLVFERKFPGKETFSEQKREENPQYVDLSLIYEVRFNTGYALQQAKLLLLRSGCFSYVEEVFLPGLFTPSYMPDDPGIGQQYYLEKINAYRAWSVLKGDTSMVVGISDTGTELDHPDLNDNIAYNYDDPVDGTDSDNDGYVDNFHGWDLGEGNNDPGVNSHAHGVLVSGVLAATTDNNEGMAGVGFKNRFLPIKIDDPYGKLIMGYESIVYAADNNCAAVNCSWGGKEGAGEYGQDIINYATYNKDMLVVAACGNSNNEVELFPASYENVISVAATNRKDYKASFSTYNYSVDIAAPGRDIYSTWVNGNYLSSSGTSFAAPMVSATAGLLRAHRPHLNALQTGQQLRMTTREIYDKPFTKTFNDQLGSGILDMYKALKDSSKSSVRFSKIFWNRQGMPGTPYDTLLISGKFTNYLKATPLNSTATLRCDHPAVVVLDSVISIGALQPLGELQNHNNPFRIIVLPNMPVDEKVHFKLHYQYKEQKDYQYFDQVFNREFFTVNTGNFKATFNSTGRMGYNDDHFQEGEGLTHTNLNKSMLNTGGLVVGSSSSRVSSAVYGETGFDHDFSIMNSLHKADTTWADHYERQYRSVFNDDSAGALKTGLTVTQNILDWTAAKDNDYIVVQYIIRNDQANTINNIYAGYYIDWSIRHSHKNRAEWHDVLEMAYVYDTDGYGAGGLKLLEAAAPVYQYAFDNDGADNSITLNDGFADYEKWLALKTKREKAGFELTKGNDVSHLLSSGPYSLNPGDSLVIAYAILAGNHLLELEQAAERAYYKYHNVSDVERETNENSLSVFPNPATTECVIQMEHATQWTYEIRTIDGKLRSRGKFSGKKHSCDLSALASGVYMLRIYSPKANYVQKLILK
ncbi:MAG: S8 family peptidase [Bacteroidales bacterium]